MGILLRMKPRFRQMVWGGTRLRDEFGYDIPGDDTGECWAIAAHEDETCEIAGGPYDGMTLSALWKQHRELFTGDAADDSPFPLLTKIIDAKEDLSIQVHPDDTYADAHENGAKGKTECWYVLGCDPGTSIVIGHNAHTAGELKSMILQGRFKELIREIPIHKGDFFQIDPGTVHAIKGGTMILETQQNSDITYRVYDYDRLSDGKPRPLHLQQALDVIRVPFDPSAGHEKGEAFVVDGGGYCTPLVSCNRYKVWHIGCNGVAVMEHREPFLLCSVIAGEGAIEHEPIRKGDHFLLTRGFNSFTLEGSLEMICSSPSIREGNK